MNLMHKYINTVLLGAFILLLALLNNVPARAADLTSIDVTPINPTINVSQTQQFTATGMFSDGTSRTFFNDAGGSTWVGKAPMSAPRFEAAAAVVNGTLYVVGGYIDNSNFKPAVTTMEAYDPVTDTWTPKAPMPTPRADLAVGVVNGILYAVGGTHDTHDYPSTTVEAYDPATDTWTPKAPMEIPRTMLAVGVVNGTLYAVGGWNGSVWLSAVEAYDPATNTWTPKAPMSVSRTDLAVGVVNGRLYAVGGWVGLSISATMEVYDPVANKWAPRASMSTPRAYLAAGVMNGRLYARGVTGVTIGRQWRPTIRWRTNGRLGHPCPPRAHIWLQA